MKPRRRIPTTTAATTPTGLIDSLRTNWVTQGTAALVTAAIAIAGYMLSPFGTLFRDWVQPEQIVVDQIVHVTEKIPQPIQIVLRSGPGGLSGGDIRLKSADESIVFSGPTSFAYPASPGSQNAAPPGGLRITAKTFGVRTIDVEVTTIKGKSFTGKVQVRSNGEAARATQTKFTGVWQMTLNRQVGQLRLQEDNNQHLTGHANLESGSRLDVVTGWRDGETFHVVLNGASKRYKAEGMYCDVSLGQEQWRIVNARLETSQNGRRVPNPTPLGSIIRRCPGFPKDLDYIDGDGAFFAAARIG